MVGYLLKNTVTENGTVARGVCEETTDNFLTQVTERTKIEKGEIPHHGVLVDLPVRMGAEIVVNFPERLGPVVVVGVDDGECGQVVRRHLPGGQARGGGRHPGEDRVGPLPRPAPAGPPGPGRRPG